MARSNSMAGQALQPGAVIGILGGGQLGRMLAMSAAQLGFRTHVFAPEADSVAAHVAPFFTCADWHDAQALAGFAQACDVITYEFENVPVAPLAALPQDLLAPAPRALEVAQDRLREKTFVTGLGGRPAPFAEVGSVADIASAAVNIGLPGILKTRRDGYDGKGQWRIADAADGAGIAIPASGCVYEGRVAFACEFSVILVRARDGEVRFWDSPRNRHEDGILAHSELPAPAIVGEQLAEARALAQRVAEELGYVGVLTCEFFATADGPVFNEMAPRVHNSGHWTIEGAVTSQFENHIRAIAGLPLGDTASGSDTVVMDNLIGAEALDLAGHLADPAAHVHLYGKGEARAGRKMGHITRVG
jgi:5-(carboxyamino)imidazole ribonucleotide synthase